MPVHAVAFDPALLPNPEVLPLPSKRGTVKRGRNRHDLQNPDPETPWGQLVAQTEAVVWPLLAKRFGRHRVHSRAVGVVPPGEPAQPWHCDLDGDTRYWTVLVPLTTEYEAGGTEFQTGEARLPVRGTAYAFHGAEMHRGAAHRGAKARIYVALVVVSAKWRGEDANVFD